jgi:hypothetical protein
MMARECMGCSIDDDGWRMKRIEDGRWRIEREASGDCDPGDLQRRLAA